MHDNIERIATHTPDLAHERHEQLRALFPEAWSEGQLDFDKLRQALGDLSDERAERYVFSWAGKRDALKLLQSPSHATLRPAPEESLSWDETQHLFIEGDNLEALKLLYKPLFGRVKMIYIDPPYNTGNDFVYPDNFSDPLKNYMVQTGQKDANGDLQTSSPDLTGRVHSRWLSMMYPRLFVARQLLKDDGVIFVSIDDNEVHHLRLLMNEVFGEENFVAQIIWQKMDSPSRNDAERAVTNFHEYVLVYARNKSTSGLRQRAKPEILAAYPLTLPDGTLARRRQMRKNGSNARREDRKTMWFPLTAPDGTDVYPLAPEGWEGRWVLSEDTWQERTEAGLTQWIKRDYGWVPYYIETAPGDPTVPWSTLWTDVDQNRQGKAEFTGLMNGDTDFENPKPSSLVKQILRMSKTPDDIILDFFAGSGTTAQAVLELNREDGGNRRFVLVQLPEQTGSTQFPTIADIAKERIRRVVARMGESNNGRLDLETREVPEDLGFKVWKLAASHFRHMEPTPQGDTAAYLQQLELMNDPLLPGWEAPGVLHEVALKEGLGLNVRLQVLAEVTDAQVWRVSDEEKGQSFLACLDESVSLEAMRPLHLGVDDLFICRGVALDDTTAANLALQCRLKMI